MDVNVVDAAGLALVEGIAHRSLFIDWALRLLLTVPMVKFGVPVGLALYAWMGQRPDETDRARLRRVTFTLLGVVLAIGIGRGLQDGMPPRDRPRIGLPDFHFPPIHDLPNLAEWSSLPSDHAILAAALATAAWAFSWRIGVVSALWAALVVAFPRLYFGYHYLTDLLAGAAFGTVVTWAISRIGRPRLLEDWYAALERRAPALVVLGLFLIGYEFITLFSTTRSVLGAVKDVLHALG
ncbi:phosphatase PAP2 family protein [Falsiroseomonas sp. CW058]|uniref:phosphatase PAP2 family protein n=1 Tax=Falsiroseomonas sp. CW058 TaxID=3388664 RepID=UPI003D31E3B6